MNKGLDTKIWLALDKTEHQIRRSAYLATGEVFQKKIYDALELIKEAKEEVEKRLDNNP